MAALRPFSDRIPGNGALSATVLANAILAEREEDAPPAANDWLILKDRALGRFPTDQEWCHLMGHGDGGDERVGNFVAGSFHCNTEQLAIESAQRPTTHQSDRFLLNSTAYLITDDSMRRDLAGNAYVSADPRYLSRAYPDSRPPRAEQPAPDAEIDRLSTNAPVAAFIRYKIIDKGADGDENNKVFDYVFEGQSEFFDRNQYNILGATVRLLLEPDKFFRDLRDTFPPAAAMDVEAPDGAGE